MDHNKSTGDGVVSPVAEIERRVGRVVCAILTLPAANPEAYESDTILVGMCLGWLQNKDNANQLVHISKRLVEIGHPEDHIRMTFLKDTPHLWQADWWPTCLAQL